MVPWLNRTANPCLARFIKMTTLVAGLSVRALAESAVGSGEDLVCLDFFGDADLERLGRQNRVQTVSLSRDLGLGFSPENLLCAAQDLAWDRVVYTSNLENHPSVVAGFEQMGVVAGNSPATLAGIRDAGQVRQFCRNCLIPYPRTLLPGEIPDPGLIWLVKPEKGGGGRGVAPWQGQSIPMGHIIQQKINGVPGSAVFAAANNRAVVLGLTRQLIGDPAFGARGYGWCGNIFPLAQSTAENSRLMQQIVPMVTAFARRFKLQGVGSLDFILDHGGRIWFLEINPRYSGSMELLDRALGLNMFAVHIRACQGHLSEPGPWQAGQYHGKGIVFAKTGLILPDTKTWAQAGHKDIPLAGDIVGAGRPLCTVFARGADPVACYKGLCQKARELEEELCTSQ